LGAYFALTGVGSYFFVRKVLRESGKIKLKERDLEKMVD
jgi:hypothetical protein